MKLFFTTMLIVVTGCGRILQSAYGIKEPMELKNEAIVKRSEALSIPKEQTFILAKQYFNFLKGKDSVRNNSNVCSPMISKYMQPLQALYFDENEQLVSMHSNCYVPGFPKLNWNFQNQFDQFIPKSTIPITDSIVNLSTLMRFIQPLSESYIYKKSPVTVVVFWSNFMFKQSKQLIQVVQNNLRLADKDVNVMYVNVDNCFVDTEVNKSAAKPILPTF